MSAARLRLCLIALVLAACSPARIGPAAVPTQPPALATSGLPAAATVPGASPTSGEAPATDLPAPQTLVISVTATPTATPTAPAARRLTDGGCCAQPFWAADSQSVLYLDRPDPNLPTGFYGVGRDGGAPQLITDRLGNFSRDLALRVFPERGRTIVERLADGQRWEIPSGGRSVSFSPGGAWVAWSEGGNNGGPNESVRRQIWVSRSDGSGARQIAQSTGGGFSGWLDDGRILVSGRPEDAPDLQALWMVTIPAEGEAAGTAVELARAARIRSTVVSPQGGWLVYLVTFSEDPAANGLWLANTATGEKRILPVFGAYRWRDESRLLLIPLEPGEASHRILQVNALGGDPVPLTDPAQTPFRIAAGDWSVAPDGSAIVYVSADDHNIWLLDLP